MTLDTFVSECEKRVIAPAVAWENDVVREALVRHDDAAAVSALDNEF